MYVIKQYDGEYTVENQLRLDSKDGKYIVFITESDAKTIKVVEEDAILNKHTWETCLINDEEVYIELWENGSFGELHIDNNGEIISISLMGLLLRIDLNSINSNENGINKSFIATIMKFGGYICLCGVLVQK